MTVDEIEKKLKICVAMESFHLPRLKRRTSRTTPTRIPIVSAVEVWLSAAGGMEAEGGPVAIPGGVSAGGEGGAVAIPGGVSAGGEGVTKTEGPVVVEDITVSGGGEGDGEGFGSTVVAIVVLVIMNFQYKRKSMNYLLVN